MVIHSHRSSLIGVGPNQFHDHFVQQLFKDSKGRLWVSSRRGVWTGGMEYILHSQKRQTYLKKRVKSEKINADGSNSLFMINMNKTDLTVDTVSHEVGLSKTILYKKIKQLTGLSPIEYIRSLRISEAAKLLRTKKYKVYEVVYMVGFSDLKYFRKCFVKEFGYPPSQLLEK